MRSTLGRALPLLLAAGATMCVAESAAAQHSGKDWAIHSMERPKPRVVDPGPYTTPPPVPSDAIVLFDGSSLDRWRSADSTMGGARWRVVDGALEVVPGTGGIRTTQGFGDAQLHLEWMAPNPPRGSGQDRGNSGVFLMGQYEVQILDSWRNDTYADGGAAAIYGQSPPLVNVTRPPGQWQTYDIVFRRPRFDTAGAVVQPARMTVIHNGVLVQDAFVLSGPTANLRRPPYAAHPDALPIGLQDHGHPVRFRNIWLRPLEENR
jgi:hypothetical protein